jgi:type IV pilus secretin PilQ/predicted competence protein
VKGFTMVPGPGKTIKVLSQAEAAQSELELGFGHDTFPSPGQDRMMTQVIPLKFVSATEIKTQIAPLVSKAGSIISDDRMNSLILTDMASNIRRLMKMIAALDTRTPQVLIEALIMEVSLTKGTKLGIEWSKNSGFRSGDHRYQGEMGQNFDVQSLITEGLKYSVIRDDFNMRLLIQALATDQKVNILSTPHIMTINNQPALIRVGEEVPILTQTRNVEGGDTIRSFDYKSVAIELEVTPRINADREVQLKVHPSVKKILGFNAELNAPILASREAQTTVIIKDGQTVVIGGLMKDDRASNRSKIPILGDIPLIGALFRTSDSSKEKTELLVFITPRVVLSSDEARALTIQKESETKEPVTPYRMDARTHYYLAKRSFNEKKYPQALENLKQVMALSPDEKLKEKAAHLNRRIEKKLKRLESKNDAPH